MKQEISAKTILKASLGRPLRNGLAVAVLGFLAVYLFRPQTTPDQAAALIAVPIVVSFAVALALGLLLLKLKVPEPKSEPNLRIKLIAVGFVFVVMAILVGLPSAVIYRSLGMIWAQDLAFRFLAISVAVALMVAVCAGTKMVFVVKVAERLLRATFPRMDTRMENALLPNRH